MRRRLLAVFALAGALTLSPTTGAYHYSVGARDAPGTAPQEEPGDADTPSELYDRGVDEDCTQRPTGLQDADDALAQTPDQDPFCGRLVYHAAVDCAGDTIATTYLFEVTDDEGRIGGGGIPAFQPDGQTPYRFGPGVHSWTDVDPFDDDPSRTTQDGTPEH
jgi:hypothetical protein